MGATLAQPANLKAALAYAAAGLPVVRVYGLRNGVCVCPKGAACPSPGKHPSTGDDWQKRATTNPKKLNQMFLAQPGAHVGVMPPEGHWLCDVDPRNGGDQTLKALLAGRQLPDTPTQRSGGGGKHYLFKGEPSGPLGKGIDIKRHGRGFVVAWPSGHASGKQYEWERAPWEVKAAPTPPCLRGGKPAQKGSEFLTEPGTSFEVEPTKVPLAQVREALAHVSADDYQRWVSFGMALKHNYGDAGEDAWLEWSRTSSKYKDGDEDKWATFDRNRDRPPITVRSIMRIARSCGYRPLTTEFEQGLWAMADIADAYDNEPAPLDWVFEPCIPAGKVTLLAGAGGSSKSYLALTLAMHLAIDQPLGPFKPVGGPGKSLLLVAEESKDDVARRLHAIRKTVGHSEAQGDLIKERVGVLPVRGLDWRLVYHDEASNLHETERVQYLIDEVRALGVRLIVLDPLIAFNGANENDNVEMGRLMFTFDRIAEQTGAAVLVLHHVSKGGQQASLNDASQAVVRGASALVDNARAALLLTRMPRADAPMYGLSAEDAGRFVVARVVKNNYGPHTSDVIFAVEQGGALRLAPEVQRMHASAAQAQRVQAALAQPVQLLRALLENPKATQRELSATCVMSLSRINQVMRELADAGHVRRIGVGRYPHYEVTKAGRAAADAEGGDSDANELF